ncbi:MAG TPA: SRPBCC domain-containing protein [bacterium]
MLLDEPPAGIDVISRDRILSAILAEYRTEDQTVILTIHQIGEAEALFDEVLFLNEGRVMNCCSLHSDSSLSWQFPPRRLVLTWAFPADEAREEKRTRVTFEVEPLGEVVRLTVTHGHLEPDSDMLRRITAGWPKVLSSLKTLLELGRPLPAL